MHRILTVGVGAIVFMGLAAPGATARPVDHHKTVAFQAQSMRPKPPGDPDLPPCSLFPPFPGGTQIPIPCDPGR